ncbi:MAG: hypothetical protein QNK03_24780 [Myxococcota bacterium]|nr:hypothetical protein [Myxococcota bacterium]
MRTAPLHDSRVLDLSSVLGIAAGLGLLLASLDMQFLALPAFVLLVPSLLFGLR